MPATASGKHVVNDMSIQVATVNGSGSQSSNTVLLRSIFQMGVPVSGKNLFPSNIAGLPTWYTIRASKDGYIARKKEIDFLVAMNPETAQEDVMSLAPGAAVLYDEPLNLNELRTDLTFYPVPYDKMWPPVCPEAKLRKLVKNMVYVGVVAQLLSIDMAEVEKALRKQFAKKVKAAELNWAPPRPAIDYAEATLTKQDPFWIERMDKTTGKIIIDGNSAAAMGCMFAGVTVVTWYPITPSSSLVETLIDYMKKYRIGPDGKATFAIVQAEDELAAIGMVLGAGWAGARSMTATAGPGISLMAEFAGLGYYAEVPGVIWDIQRVGPSTGLPTRTSQGDMLSAAFLSHGDTKHIMLFPASVKECFTMAGEAFDLAEQLQTPVFVLSDLDLGMNNWMSEPFHVSREADRSRQGAERRRSRPAGRIRALQGCGRRWHSVIARCPGPIIPRRRALPAAADTTRSRSTASAGRLREQHGPAGAQVRDRAQAGSRAGDGEANGKSKIGIIAYGTTHWALSESLRSAQKEYDVETDYLRDPRLSVHARDARVRCAARARVRDRAEPRRADAPAAEARSARRRRSPSCAACATTTGCRSMRAPSPTKSFHQEGK